MKKVYIGIINDHSGSMASNGKAAAAKTDFNNLLASLQKDSANFDVATLVSVLGCGVTLEGCDSWRATYGNKFSVMLMPPNNIGMLTTYSANGNTL